MVYSLQVPQEVAGCGLLFDGEFHRSLCFCHLLVPKVRQNLVLHITVDCDAHLNFLLFLLRDHYLQDCLYRNLPLQPIELNLIGFGVEAAIRVEHEDLRDDEEAGLLHAVGVLLE